MTVQILRVCWCHLLLLGCPERFQCSSYGRGAAPVGKPTAGSVSGESTAVEGPVMHKKSSLDTCSWFGGPERSHDGGRCRSSSWKCICSNSKQCRSAAVEMSVNEGRRWFLLLALRLRMMIAEQLHEIYPNSKGALQGGAMLLLSYDMF